MRLLSFLFVVLVSSTIVVAPSFARVEETRWQPRKPLQGRVLPMSMSQLKMVLTPATRLLLSENFFKKDLPEKVVLARIDYSGPFHYDSKAITNLVLNVLAADLQIVVVNQDIVIDNKTNLNLISYLDRQKTREKGVLLGADYVISGNVREFIETHENGDHFRVVVTKLQLNELRSDRLVFAKEYEKKFSRN